jgi:hypothetical protein
MLEGGHQDARFNQRERKFDSKEPDRVLAIPMARTVI